MSDKHEAGNPLWLLQQNIANYEGQAVAFGADAVRYQQKADDARKIADKFKQAYELLKESAYVDV